MAQMNPVCMIRFAEGRTFSMPRPHDPLDHRIDGYRRTDNDVPPSNPGWNQCYARITTTRPKIQGGGHCKRREAKYRKEEYGQPVNPPPRNSVRMHTIDERDPKHHVADRAEE